MAVERLRRTLRAQRALLAVGLSVLTASSGIPARAQTASDLDCSKVLKAIPDQFPAWSDGSSGWEDPSHYSTIQLADIDGDGQAELLARGPAGILVNHFDVATGVWIARKPGPPLSDENGFDQPQYYSTIQTGDIDGGHARQAELIVRDSLGLETWAYEEGTDTWKQLGTSGGPFPPTDNGTSPPTNWALAPYYTTIQIADIDGTPGAELIGRSTEGIQTYRWNGATNTWDRLGSGAGPFADGDATTPWYAAPYYTTIQLANVDGAGGAELIGRGSHGIQVFEWNASSNSWDLLGSSVGPFGDDDDGGWFRPENYSTIQLGNLDGGERAELLGRSDDGILAYRWDVQNHTWTQLGSQSRPFGDRTWASPEYYSTIQVADVDGDSVDELIGRGSGGLVVLRRGPGDFSDWTQVATLPSMSDDEGWALPQSYLTIQSADVDGRDGVEILGKANDGIETWRYGGSAFAATLVRAFAAFTGGQFAAYQEISERLSKPGGLVPENNNDVRSHYTNAANTSESWDTAAAAALALVGTPPSSGISQSDWDAVAAQLGSELVNVHFTYVWFDNLDDLQTRIVEDNDGTVDLVQGYLAIPSDVHTPAILSILNLVFNFVSALAKTVPGAPELNFAGSVAGLVSTSYSAALAASGSPPNIQAELVELQQQIIDRRVQAQESTACLEIAFLQNSGLLTALGQAIESGALAWDKTDNPAMAARARVGYEVSIWQALTPLHWIVDCNSETVRCNCGGDPPSPYPDEPDGAPLIYTSPPTLGFKTVAWIHEAPLGACEIIPAKDTFDHLFHAPDDANPGNLEVSLEDVHCGFNGWHIPGSIGNACVGDPLGATAHQLKKKNLAARAQIQALIGRVKSDVKDKATQANLIESLHQASALLQETREVSGTSLTQLAELSLQGFILQVKAHSGEAIRVDRAQKHIALAHDIRELLTVPPASVVLGSDLAHQKNP